MRLCRPTLTATDHSQLTAYVADQVAVSIADHESLTILRGVLRNAQIIADASIGPDVVTLDSECVLRDMQTGDCESYTLVFPDEADISAGRLSVLAPLGASLLGQRVGSVVRVPCPVGVRAVAVERLLYQPEAADRESLAGPEPESAMSYSGTRVTRQESTA